jgi:hypothetical protein
MSAIVDCESWVNAVEAARRLNVSLPVLPRTAPLLGIKVRRFPGKRGSRYNAADIEAALKRMDAQEAAVIAAAQQSFGLPPARSGRARGKGRTAARTAP